MEYAVPADSEAAAVAVTLPSNSTVVCPVTAIALAVPLSVSAVTSASPITFRMTELTSEPLV